MDENPLGKHKKKLIMVAILLVVVALLVGGEDNPGMVAQLSETAERSQQPVPLTPATPIPAQPPQRSTASPSRQDDALDDWYAAKDPAEFVDPVPLDESHLINDAKPMVSTEPLVR